MTTSSPPAGLTAAPPSWHSTRRARLGWYGYDWANSVFTTSVTSVFFGPYLTDAARAGAGPDGSIHPLGIGISAASYVPFVIGLSVFLQIFVLPTAAALTTRHHKGRLLGVLLLVGGGAATAMYTIGETDYLLGGALFVLATIALGGSITVCNTYLPVIAPPERQDRTSAEASAAGFLSAGLILIVDLVVYNSHDRLGLTESEAIRIIMMTAGLWWLVFGGVSVMLLRGYGAPAATAVERVGSYRLLGRALRDLRRYPAAGWFLAAFLLYFNGVQAVTGLVGTYAVEALRLELDQVIIAVLVVQFAAVLGTAALGRVAERYGGRTVLVGSVVFWCAVIITGGVLPAGWFGGFLALCVSAGLVVGGTYALSRSVFIRLVPQNRVPEYVGIFETVNRCLGFLGPAAFGLVLQWSGNYRMAWLSILVFMVAGAVTLVAAPRPEVSHG
ncbi:UMF1 family MFS transporter [Kribbella aluminosa]|uniref:UMF1 family MFS transporter n=1 Tax=Kribbella aluminosa TaxID=416017 RepID=A0ABS4UZP9_9ACTN|nr:MFS transporter [Kribbella aluminosa]MBP2357127.1 UMF1 family MFS transporter [Kribbella aluminosa]